MAGIAFWGGFASGMSESIEKNRDRQLKQKQLDAENSIKIKKAQADQEESLFKLQGTAQEGFAKLNEELQGIRSKDWKGTDAERVSAENDVKQRKLDLWKSVAQRGTDLGAKSPTDVYDIYQEDIGQVGTYTSDKDGTKYVIPKELAMTIQDSNGQLKIEDGKIMNQVMEQNSQGVWIPREENGQPVYEPSGETLKRYDDVYKPLDSASAGATNETRYIDNYLKINAPDDATEVELASLKNQAAKEYRNIVLTGAQKDIKATNEAVKFGNGYLVKKYGQDIQSIDYSTLSAQDKKMLNQTADTGIQLKLGKSEYSKLMPKVKRLENKNNKMLQATQYLQEKIDSGEDVNLFKQSITQYFSSFFGYSEEQARDVANNKQITTQLNIQRHMLYGSVLTKGENESYQQQASSLFKSNKDLFIAAKEMISEDISALEEIEATIGEDLFKMKYGNLLIDQKKKLANMDEVANRKETSLDRARTQLEKETTGTDANALAKINERFKDKSQAFRDKVYADYLASKNKGAK